VSDFARTRELIRQQREALRVAAEEARTVAEQARHATVEAVPATAQALEANLAQMQFLEEARKTPTVTESTKARSMTQGPPMASAT
jgi:hypothetical protein